MDLEFLTSALRQYGLKEERSTKHVITNGTRQRITTTVLGLFYDENRYYGFIHASVIASKRPNSVVSQFKDSILVDQLYAGDSFYLVKTDSQVRIFNAKFIFIIKNVISMVDNPTLFTVKEHRISTSGKLFFLVMTDGSIFIAAGYLRNKESIEIERFNLVSKVDSASHFFDLELPQRLVWSRLRAPKGATFELLVERLLSSREGLSDVQPIGKTNASDRGRDFIVIETIRDLNGKQSQVKWLIQCKFTLKCKPPQIRTGLN